jgi:hypothetical protein
VLTAIDREKQLKGWRRSKKIALSECLNPHWLDLSRGWYSQMKDGGASRDASTPSARSQATGLPTLSHDTSPRKITPTQHPCVRSEPHPVILCGAEESLPPRRTSFPPALLPFFLRPQRNNRAFHSFSTATTLRYIHISSSMPHTSCGHLSLRP